MSDSAGVKQLRALAESSSTDRLSASIVRDAIEEILWLQTRNKELLEACKRFVADHDMLTGGWDENGHFAQAAAAIAKAEGRPA